LHKTDSSAAQVVRLPGSIRNPFGPEQNFGNRSIRVALNSPIERGKGEMLTQVERISKKIILAAGLRAELTFRSFGRHGGATESKLSGLTELQLMEKGQWSSTAAMDNYLHDDDEGTAGSVNKAHKRRAKSAKQEAGK
jgi:hypothetical protein